MSEVAPAGGNSDEKPRDASRSERREQSENDAVDAELIPEDVQEAIARRVEMHLEHYSSPYPHPDHLERYAALYPEAPKIVFESYRQQTDHRRAMETKFMNGSERRAFVGQWLAFGLVLAVIGAGIFAIAVGQAVAGATIITGGLGGGVILAVSGAGNKPLPPARKPRPTQRKTGHASSEVEESPASGAQPTPPSSKGA